MQSYNGKSDPLVHFYRYEQHLEVLGATKKVKCICFPLFLIDTATMWFRRLEPGSIDSWDILEKLFISRFRVHTIQPKDAISLANVKQWEGETLNNYLERFNAIVAEVKGSGEDLKLMAIVAGFDKRS